MIVGGAKMFALGAGLDIGARNDAAVRAALAAQRIRIARRETGGSSGRTMRVTVGAGSVSVHVAGGKPVMVLGPGLRGSSAPVARATGPSSVRLGYGMAGAA